MLPELKIQYRTAGVRAVLYVDQRVETLQLRVSFPHDGRQAHGPEGYVWGREVDDHSTHVTKGRRSLPCRKFCSVIFSPEGDALRLFPCDR